MYDVHPSSSIEPSTAGTVGTTMPPAEPNWASTGFSFVCSRIGHWLGLWSSRPHIRPAKHGHNNWNHVWHGKNDRVLHTRILYLFLFIIYYSKGLIRKKYL